MSQTRRLGQLYAAEGWLNNYRYLVNADFKAYDFESLRTTLLDHVKTNYPEDFNDFINSSEYVAIIDMMAFIGQNLAFRADLNLRETFLETAEVRGNILSIARQLGYKPFRNGAASGFLRISAINTTQNLYDSKGTNLAGQTIVWGDPLNSDFNEQFTVILNQVLNKANPVGRPVSSIVSNGVSRQLYQIDQPETRTMVEPFTITAKNNNSYSCELVPAEIDADTELAVEGLPNPYGYLTTLFNNDGTGYSSLSNGWFFLFKQGSLKFEDYVLDTKVENRVIDLNGTNINETDVWVQSISANGEVLFNWTSVPNTIGKNIIFNGVSKDDRKVYEIIARENDAVSLKFGDDAFADIPTGNIRIWYRESANEILTIGKHDVAGLQLVLRYIDASLNEQDLLITLELVDSVSSTASESISQIKNRASKTAASQDRMITASDYNIYPEGKVSGIAKIKAINRTHSGQSVYADLSDPSGTYRPVITLADDGFIYVNEITSDDTRTNENGKSEIFNWIENSLLDRMLHQLYYKKYDVVVPETAISWVKVDSNNATTNGHFAAAGTGVPLRVGRGTPDLKFRTIKKDTLIKTRSGQWSKILDVYREGLGVGDIAGTNTGLRANGQGAVFINTITDTIDIDSWFPALRTIFAPTEKVEIIKELAARRSFGLRYDQTFDRWRVIKADNVDTYSYFSNASAGNTANLQLDASWLIRLEYSASTDTWTSTIRKDQTVFGSVNQLTFQNQRFGQALDSGSRRVIKDSIKFLTQNTGLTEELEMSIADYFKLDDGRYDTKRVLLLLPGLTSTLVPNDPSVITRIIQNNDLYLKEVQFVDAPGQYTMTPSPYAVGVTGPIIGRTSLKVQHNHVPLRDNRVDATTTNIIDMFVLTSEYNTAYRTWVTSGATVTTTPLSLTSFGLEKLMAAVLPYKSISDSVVFHPVNYKVIFGKNAELRNQVTIRITKSDTTRISDAEIRSRVIGAMDLYFEIDNWDFGETFYFTDMASWIHKTLAGVISSITLIPKQRNLTTNDMFQIPCDDDEIFISSATVNDVEIVTSTMSVTNK